MPICKISQLCWIEIKSSFDNGTYSHIQFFLDKYHHFSFKCIKMSNSEFVWYTHCVVLPCSASPLKGNRFDPPHWDCEQILRFWTIRKFQEKQNISLAFHDRRIFNLRENYIFGMEGGKNYSSHCGKLVAISWLVISMGTKIGLKWSIQPWIFERKDEEVLTRKFLVCKKNFHIIGSLFFPKVCLMLCGKW